MKNLLFTVFYCFIVCSILLSAMLVVTYATSKVANAGALENLRASTVRVNGATGAIVQGKSGKKYLVTNWHVCAFVNGKARFLTGTFDSGYEVTGPIKLKDPESDLCAAEINEPNLPALTISKYDESKDLITRGYPGGHVKESYGYSKGKLDWECEVDIELIGACPGRSKVRYYHNGQVRSCVLHWSSVLTNLFSRPGSSGSPVLDNDGYLAGIMSSHDSNYNDYAGGMVSTEQVRAFLDRL